MKLSQRGAVAPFLIMETFRDANELARSGKSIIHLSLGQPGVEVPQRVRDMVAEKMRTAPLGYTEAAGMPELRQSIANYYKQFYKLDIPTERIFVTIGSSSAFLMTLLSAFDQGDQVAITAPCYPAYPSMLEAVNLKPVFLRGTAETRFQPTIEMLEALPELTQGLILASPSNPAGTILHDEDLQKFARFSEQHKVRLICDEIYHRVTFGQSANSMLAYTDQAVIVNSFSKYFLMPGWRLGWAVVPPQLVRSFESLAQNFYISPPAIAQYAAIEIFNCIDELDKVVESYARNRELLLKELPEAGITKLAPAEGAFFIYADVSDLTSDSADFCRRMLHETGVVTVAGYDFDRELGGKYVRFSYSGKEEDMAEAMRRLKVWLKK